MYGDILDLLTNNDNENNNFDSTSIHIFSLFAFLLNLLHFLTFLSHPNLYTLTKKSSAVQVRRGKKIMKNCCVVVEETSVGLS